MKTVYASVIAVAIVTATASPALAEQPRQAIVELADLDLKTSQGVQELETRMAYAISRVCHASDARSPQQIKAVRQCRRDLHANAKSSLAQLQRRTADSAPSRLAVVRN